MYWFRLRNFAQACAVAVVGFGEVVCKDVCFLGGKMFWDRRRIFLNNLRSRSVEIKWGILPAAGFYVVQRCNRQRGQTKKCVWGLSPLPRLDTKNSQLDEVGPRRTI